MHQKCGSGMIMLYNLPDLVLEGLRQFLTLSDLCNLVQVCKDFQAEFQKYIDQYDGILRKWKEADDALESETTRKQSFVSWDKIYHEIELGLKIFVTYMGDNFRVVVASRHHQKELMHPAKGVLGEKRYCKKLTGYVVVHYKLFYTGATQYILLDYTNLSNITFKPVNTYRIIGKCACTLIQNRIDFVNHGNCIDGEIIRINRLSKTEFHVSHTKNDAGKSTVNAFTLTVSAAPKSNFDFCKNNHMFCKVEYGTVGDVGIVNIETGEFIVFQRVLISFLHRVGTQLWKSDVENEFYLVSDVFIIRLNTLQKSFSFIDIKQTSLAFFAFCNKDLRRLYFD